MYIEWLGEERKKISIKIDDIYCKHESNYDVYRNNYRNQMKNIQMYPIELYRTRQLAEVLIEQGKLYPIALYKFREGYMCVDGHHRIKAYLFANYNAIPGIVYKDKEEALRAKAIPYTGV